MSKSFAVIRSTKVRGTGIGLGALAASLLATPSQAALVSACSGVSLPRSVVTDIIRDPLLGIANPLQGTVNTLIGALDGLPVIGGVLDPLLPPTVTIDVAGLLGQAADGENITVRTLALDGTLVGPEDQCLTTADGYQLDTPAGIAIGGNSITGLGSGTAATATTLDSIAFGNAASTTAAGATAIGTGTSVTVANSVAVGNGSTAGRGAQVGYAAPGLAAPQTSAGEFSVGAAGQERQITNVAAGSAPTDAANVAQVTAAITASNAAVALQYSDALTPTTPNGGVPTNDVTLVGGAPGAVALHNVAPGVVAAGSTDAVNGGQLSDTNTQVATNTAGIATNSANITTNTTAITSLNNGTAGVVRQVGGAPGTGTVTIGAETGGTLVDLAGNDGTRTLSGVTAGVVGAGSTDAVNGSQLFATDTQVATNTGNIATNSANIAGNTTAITNLSAGVGNGTIGLLQQVGGAPGTGALTAGAQTGGTEVAFAGTDGNRRLTGVLDGVAATDAATVGQVTALGATVADSVQYDTAGGVRLNTITLAGGAAGPVTIANVSPTGRWSRARPTRSTAGSCSRRTRRSRRTPPASPRTAPTSRPIRRRSPASTTARRASSGRSAGHRGRVRSPSVPRLVARWSTWRAPTARGP